MKSQVTKERIKASIYGLLIGDALGCPVEGCTAREIGHQFGRLTEMEYPKERQFRPKGLHSDDGQQAIALCDALLRNKHGAPEEFASILLAMYRAPLPVSKKLSFFFGLHRGHGKNFRATVKALDHGASVTQCGQPSSGNGSAMLIAPLAMYYRDASDAELREHLLPIVRVKTYDVRGIAAAAAMAVTIRHFINHGDRCTATDREQIVAFVRVTESMVTTSHDKHQHVFSDALAAMFRDMDKPPEAVLTAIAHRAAVTALMEVGPTLGYAVASVVTSIYFGLCAKSFRSAIEEVIALGGDTDTTAAMVGAIAGARFGFSAIPCSWYDDLQAKGAFDDRIEGLLHRPQEWQPKHELVALETEWCKLYDSPQAKAWLAQRKAEKRAQRKAKPVQTPSKQKPVLIDGVQVDGHWLCQTYNRSPGPWLGACLPVIRQQYFAGKLQTIQQLDELLSDQPKLTSKNRRDR